MDQRLTRRAFVIHVGAAAALLGRGVPSAAQTSPAPVPGKDKLIVRSPRPINLETPLKDLGSEITPIDLFFVRNNYDGPEMDAGQYVLKVSLLQTNLGAVRGLLEPHDIETIGGIRF